MGKKYFALIWLLSMLLLSGVFTNTVRADCDDKSYPGMDWSGCKKMNKMLDNKNFSGSKFDKANLSSSKLDNSNFTGASLVKTDLTRASLNQSIFYRPI